MSDDEVMLIAIDHVRWAKTNGQSFAMIVASVHDFASPTFDGAVDAIARAQVLLTRHQEDAQ